MEHIEGGNQNDKKDIDTKDIDKEKQDMFDSGFKKGGNRVYEHFKNHFGIEIKDNKDLEAFAIQYKDTVNQIKDIQNKGKSEFEVKYIELEHAHKEKTELLEKESNMRKSYEDKWTRLFKQQKLRETLRDKKYGIIPEKEGYAIAWINEEFEPYVDLEKEEIKFKKGKFKDMEDFAIQLKEKQPDLFSIATVSGIQGDGYNKIIQNKNGAGTDVNTIVNKLISDANSQFIPQKK